MSETAKRKIMVCCNLLIAAYLSIMFNSYYPIIVYIIIKSAVAFYSALKEGSNEN